MSDLQFDPLKMDTNLAEEYLKKHNKEFKHLIPLKGSGTYKEDKIKNKIHMTEDFDVVDLLTNAQFQGTRTAYNAQCLQVLSKKVKENTELFCQLEYLIRDLRPTDVKNDLNLLINHLMYRKKNFGKNIEHFNLSILMCDRSPLALLGFFCEMVTTKLGVCIQALPNTAVVCHLFTELAQQAGVPVYLAMVPEANGSLTLKVDDFDELATGCTGIVTEKSDVDSAVDAFVNASYKYPWRLRRILVQESTYEYFVKAMAFRSTDQKQESGDIEKQCKYYYKCGDKSFAFDYTGEQLDDSMVTVEAYRTNNELLKLLSFGVFSISLWASDISEAHEIAYSVPSNIVWVNDYGKFSGPPKSAQAFYSLGDYHDGCVRINDHFEIIQKWFNLTLSKRKSHVFKALIDYNNQCPKDMQNIPDVIRLYEDFEVDSFVEVQSGAICTGVEYPVGAILVNFPILTPLKDVVEAALVGNALLILVKSQDSKLYSMLQKEGVPVKFIDFLGAAKYKVGKCCWSQTKVVWTNYGTTFAN